MSLTPTSASFSKDGPRLQKEPQPNGRCYFSITLAMVGAIMFGLDQGNFGNVQAFDDFCNDWCLGHGYGDATTCANGPGGAVDNVDFQNNFVRWGNCLITFGAMAGALILGPVLAMAFGRRLCISVGAAITFGACLFASYLTFDSVTVFMVARFVTGFGVGVCTFALPMYNAELATPAIRGRTGSLFQFFVVLGVAIAVFMTTGIQNWKFGILLPGVGGAIVMVAIWTCPESPRYVMQKKSFEAGMVELKKVRMDEDVTEEANAMWQSLQEEQAAGVMPWSEMATNSSVSRRVTVAICIMVFQQFTGINFFVQYAGTIFTKIGLDNPLTVNCIINGFFLVGICAGIYLIDYDGKMGGRRPAFVASSLLCGVPMVIAAIAVLLKWPGGVIIAMVAIYSFGFQVAWGPAAWVYCSEIFNMRERDRANGLAVGLEYGANAVILFLTPVMVDWSIFGSFVIFAACNIFFVFFCAMLPETKGVPLEHIPALFGGVKPTPLMGVENTA
jgi:SP family arabinose:H+ symporter-like MFS transporter